MTLSFHSARRRVAFVTVALAACTPTGTDGSSNNRHVSDAELHALPELAVAEGRLVCTAIGADACPLRSAVANWLGRDRVALWEPGREIMILDAKSPQGRNFGVVGQSAGQYAFATAVGPFRGNIAVIDLQRAKMVQYNAEGVFDREDDIPRPDANSAPGFIGAIPVLQSIHAAKENGVARMTLDVLESQTQTKGTRVLDVPIPWLRLTADSAIGASPLFPASPRYAVDVNKTIIWTPSDSFWVERRTFDGKVRWTLSSDRKGEVVTAAEIAARRDEISRSAPRDYLRPGDLDSMTAHTAKAHPVIGGIVLEPGGRMLITGAAITSSDSIEYIVLTRDGVPTHRFSLASRVRPLLLAGDSLLVHRPTAGEPLEVRWLFLRSRT